MTPKSAAVKILGMRSIAAFPLLLFLLLVACAPARRSRHCEEGLASWYGEPFHGRVTSSGETYDMHKFPAAHRDLPFGTIVRVRNRRNGKTVDVKINDRGPWVRGRIIDLSYAAAKRLDMVMDGVVPVRVEILKWGR